MDPIPPVSSSTTQAPGGVPRLIAAVSGPQIDPGERASAPVVDPPGARWADGFQHPTRGAPGEGVQGSLSPITTCLASDGLGSASTVSELASKFKAFHLVPAAIQAGKPHDFSSRASPSGDLVNSRTLSALDKMYLDAAEGPHADEFARVLDGYAQAQLELDEVLRDRLPEAGLTVVENDGANENLSLIISMLHHTHKWAGVQQSWVEARALEVSVELAGRANALGATLQLGRGLSMYRPLLIALAEHIFGPGNVPPMLIMMGGDQGRPLLCDPLRDQAGDIDLATVPHDTAVIIEQSRHFEAVANTSGLPWSRVLAQLQEAPDVAWRQVLQPLQTMGITSTMAGGRRQQHRWQRGAQTRLAPQDMLGLAPLVQARAMAEAQGVVDEVLTSLERWVVFDLGQTPADDDAQVHRLGLSPLDDYHKQLPKNKKGVVSLDGLREGETGHQYNVEAQVREGRLIALTVQSSGEGDIVVHYDNPWSRPVPQTPSRKSLTHPDDLDAFDEFAPRALAARQAGDPSRFADFLRHLCGLRLRGTGMTWKAFRDLSEKERDRYLRQAVANGHVGPGVPTTVRRAIDPQRAVQPKDARASLHPDDLKAFDEFATRAHAAAGQSHDPGCFAAFLRYLREHENAMTWKAFCDLSEDVRNAYLSKAVADGHVEKNVRATVRRAIDPQLTVQPKEVLRARDSLHPDDLAAFDEFAPRAHAAGQRHDPPNFAAFLRDLRKRGLDMTWEEFRNTLENVRNEYLNNAVAHGHLSRNVPTTVRRAIANPES